MDITLDITKEFNTLVNYEDFLDGGDLNPIIFLSFPYDIKGKYTFEMMNLGLNLSDEMDESFMRYRSYFNDIIDCDYEFRRILICGKSKIEIEGVKGGDVSFSAKNNILYGEKFYHTWPYRVEKGDYLFTCGGYSSFSPHFTTINIIGNSKSTAKITFSSEDYFLIDSDEGYIDQIAANKQHPYEYINQIGKTFLLEYTNKHFELKYDNGYNTDVAIESE